MQPDHAHLDPSAAPFAELLAECLLESGQTLEQISGQLGNLGTPVSVATLSYWQTGRSLPRRASSLKAVAHLETLLGLPLGHLSQALPGQRSRLLPSASVRPPLDALNLVLAEMGFDSLSDAEWRGVTTADHVTVGRDRSEVGLQSDQVVRCMVDGLTRVPVVYLQDASGPVRPLVSALRGCSLGEVHHLPEHHMVIGELLLPRTLSRGEHCTYSYRVECEPSDIPALRWDRGLMSEHLLYVCTVDFLGEPPVAAAHYYRERAAADTLHGPPEDEAPSGSPVPIGGKYLEAVVPHARPGVHGVSWRW